MPSRPDSAPDASRVLRAELVRKASALVGSAEMLATTVDGLTIYRHTAPTAPTAATYQPSVAVVIQGKKRVWLGDTSLVYDTARFLLTSLDLPVTSQVIAASDATPYLCLHVKLRLPVVREVLGQGDRCPPAMKADARAMTTGATTAQLLAACNRLLDMAGEADGAPFLAGLIEREIIYRILQSAEGKRLRAIATLGDQSQRTAKAVAWIIANYTRPLRVDALARRAGMGVSTLHRQFRALTAMSPLQFQKHLRLHAARQRMLADGLDATSAAFAVGYESASQFSREYNRYFGQPPMRDVRTLLHPDAADGQALPHPADVLETERQ